MSKKIALLIGVSEYGEGIPSLSAPPKDVEVMKRVLENPKMGEFSDVQTLINPELVPMQQSIHKLFKNATQEDLVLLFFSGHGITDDDNRLFLATQNTSKDDFESTAVSAHFIQNASKNCYAKRQIIILDCCYSGAFAIGWHPKSVGLDLRKELGAEGRVVLTSSTATQSSFQQEGAELSLYTQYLVEGIETGAADKDGDGKIHVSELHEYAKAKVQEVKPKMQPGIILDKEGYDIFLSQAPVNDPALDFRKLVEKYAKDGSISERRREIFKVKQQEYGISDERAEEVINSVLEPFQRRLKNLARYKEEFQKEVERQYPLDARTEEELRDWQQSVLGLNDEDVVEIQQQVISELDDLNSEVGVDYTQLRDLLRAEKWQEANEETGEVMLKVSKREQEGWLRVEDIEKFPCTDLCTIDQLWVKYSNGRFGFSVQKRIWQEIGATLDIETERELGERTGWRRNGKWLEKSQFTFTTQAPSGHLPCVGKYSGIIGWGGDLRSVLSFWNLRSVVLETAMSSDACCLFLRAKTCNL